MKIDTIFIANIGEMDIPLTKFMNKDRKEYQIYENHALCDRFVFSDHDSKLLITPFPLDKEFVNDAVRLMQYKKFINLWPGKLCESICQSILKDKQLFAILVQAVKSNPKINLIAYAATTEFIDFVLTLKKMGLKFKTPELPREDRLWLVPYFNTKAGFRQAVPYLGNDFPPMAEGYICDNTEQVISWAKYFLAGNKGCVIKTNGGTAGEGVKIIRKKDIEGKNIDRYLSDFVKSEPCWQTGLIVVEEYQEADIPIAGGNPSVEYMVTAEKIIPLYVCGMRVTSEGAFKGVEFGKNAVPKNLEEKSFKLGASWAKFLQKRGYRGFFDVDCIYAKKDKIIPLESNIRRTGGTHVYELAKRLLGINFLTRYYVASNNLMRTPCFAGKSYKDVKRTVNPLLYPIKNKKEGVIITVYHVLKQGNLGYAVIGPNRSRVLEIEKDFLKRLS
jgi:hypothetical protein